MSPLESPFIGIDSSKHTLDVACGADPQAPLETMPSTEAHRQLLVPRLPRLQTTLDEQCASLRDLLVRREQVIQMRTTAVNRLTAAVPNLRPGIQTQSDWPDQEINAVAQERNDDGERTDEVRRKRELRDSVPGIGAITALNLLLRLPELGTINRREAAAFEGVAP